MTELEEKILNAAIDVFAEKGLKFTMDDVASKIKISKKTLYKVYKSKEEMLNGVVDYCFADIKRSERELAQNKELDIVEKIRRVMVVLPDRYQNIGLSSLYQLKDKYPDVYKRVENYLVTDWDGTIELINQGIREGKIRNISIPVMKAMFESTIESFMATSVLVDNNMTYEEGMQELINTIVFGISK